MSNALAFNETAEEWRPLPSGNFYEVSSFGRIRSWKCQGRRFGLRRKSPRILRPKITRGGYLSVALQVDGRSSHRTVHSIVAEVFLGERPDGCVVNHKDFNKQNNHPDNIEYVTRQENERHALVGGHKQNTVPIRQQLSNDSPTRRLTAADVLSIRKLFREGATVEDIGSQFGIKANYVISVCKGRKWGWLSEGISQIPRIRRGSSNTAAKLTEEQVVQIRQQFKRGSTALQLSKQFGVGKSTIWRVVRRTHWRHIADVA